MPSHKRWAINAALASERAALFESERSVRLEVERVNKELEAFVYSTSHDLKRPIISLSGYMGYLQQDFGALIPSEGQHYLERMHVCLGYMEALIDDLLELSRIGRVDTEPADVDVERLVVEIADDLGRAYPGAHFEVGELPVVSLNPVRARQLFTNLVGNAVEHAGRNDVTVRVSAEPVTQGLARLCVADDGTGVEREFRERVFEPFERLAVSPPGAGGTGIGLAICRKITERAGGRIWIGDSSAGTAVYLEMPLAVGRGMTWERQRQPAA